MRRLTAVFLALSLLFILPSCGRALGGTFPDHWYQVTSSMSGKMLTQEFKFEEPADLLITVVTNRGDMQLGIKNTDTGEYEYELREFNNTSDTVALPAGDFELIMYCKNHTGSFALEKG